MLCVNHEIEICETKFVSSLLNGLRNRISYDVADRCCWFVVAVAVDQIWCCEKLCNTITRIFLRYSMVNCTFETFNVLFTCFCWMRVGFELTSLKFPKYYRIFRNELNCANNLFQIFNWQPNLAKPFWRGTNLWRIRSNNSKPLSMIRLKKLR